MTVFTNSEGLVITYTNELVETSLLQLNSSKSYYTSSEHDIICIKTDSNNTLILYYTYLSTEPLFQIIQ